MYHCTPSHQASKPCTTDKCFDMQEQTDMLYKIAFSLFPMRRLPSNTTFTSVLNQEMALSHQSNKHLSFIITSKLGLHEQDMLTVHNIWLALSVLISLKYDAMSHTYCLHSLSEKYRNCLQEHQHPQPEHSCNIKAKEKDLNFQAVNKHHFPVHSREGLYLQF